MNTLRYGSTGPQVEMLQLGLNRTGLTSLNTDGIFGFVTESSVNAFKRARGLPADGIVDTATWDALSPYLSGYFRYTIQPGDTLFGLAIAYNTTIQAIETANPGIDPYNLQAGRIIVIPLGFPVIPTTISFTSTLLEFAVKGLAARYPFLITDRIGNSVMGKDLHYFQIGTGKNEVFYNASHHANEWITTPVLLKFLEDYARAYANGGNIFGIPAAEIYETTSLYIVPVVNPDGVDLVTGDLRQGAYYEMAKSFAGNYPAIPFPCGWKANIQGVDLNLQYPAAWERAREIKFSQGFVSPSPRDFVGDEPLTEPEALAVYNFALNHNFQLILAYHTQGEVIYWQFMDYRPQGAFEIGQLFSRVSGYALEETPYASSFAGFKDWFIQQYNRPGYTIEAGFGISPLPISQFDRIYADNFGILTLGAIVTAERFCTAPLRLLSL